MITHGSHHDDSAHLRSHAFHRYWIHELDQMGTEQILHWTVDTYANRIALATSFEPNGCVLIAMLSEILPRIDIIETSFGYSFYNTHALKSILQLKYDITLSCCGGTDSDGKYYHFDTESHHSGVPRRYLSQRAFETIRRPPVPYDVLICCDTQQQIPTGEALPIMEWDPWLQITKIYPLARWGKASLWNKIDRESIPYSPFFDTNTMFQRPRQRDFISAVFQEAGTF